MFIKKKARGWRHSVFSAQVSVCPLSLFIRGGGGEDAGGEILCSLLRWKQRKKVQKRL